MDEDEVNIFQVLTSAGPLACEISGSPDNPVVVLLHGAHQHGGLKDWKTHLPILKEQNIYAVSVSFPGCGDNAAKSPGALLPYRPDLVLMPNGPVCAILDLFAQLKHHKGVRGRMTVVGEGWGAVVALAMAQWKPDLIEALVLFQCSITHGRFPFQRHELLAFSKPTLVIWAEAESLDDRVHPQLEQSHVLVKAMPSAVLRIIHKYSLDAPPSKSLALASPKSDSSVLSATSSASSVSTAASPNSRLSKYDGWPNRHVYEAAHGVFKYEERAAVAVACEEASERAPTREEANEFTEKGKLLRELIDADIHLDRMRMSVAEEIARFTLEHSTQTEGEGEVFFRHGMELFEGPPASIDPHGHGVVPRGEMLDLGEFVFAAKKTQIGSHAAMQQLEQYRAEALGSRAASKRGRGSSKQGCSPGSKQFAWSFPEPASEQLARSAVELGVVPLPQQSLRPGTVVGKGVGGRQNTFAVEYADGDIESAVHRFRIIGHTDPVIEQGMLRPPLPFTEKVIATRMFSGNVRKEVFVRSMGEATAYPLLLLHGSGNEAWGRDLEYFAEPLVQLGYRIILPDLPGFGRSLGHRAPSSEDAHLDEAGSIQILEDIMKAFGWFPNGQEGISHVNAPLDILGFSTGFGLGISFALKHGGGGRVGAVVSLNGLYRSGFKDASLTVDAVGKGDKQPITASTELAKLSMGIRTFVLYVGPDLVHPRSLSVDLADKVRGAMFEEINYQDQIQTGVRTTSTMRHTSTNTTQFPPISPPRQRKLEGDSNTSSKIPNFKSAARHCFELHSGLIIPRVTNWLMLNGTANESIKASIGVPPKLLSPFRKGLSKQNGPGCL